MTAAAMIAYKALVAAMAESEPSCRGDDRFTSDSTADDAELAEHCACCPLRSACRAYARIERPDGGFWAGIRYPRPIGRPKDKDGSDA